MPDLVIYELDPTGGFCGFPAEIPGLPPANLMRQELVRRSQIVNEIKRKLQIEIRRVFLRNAGAIDNQIAKNFVQQEGVKAFPIVLYGSKIIHAGSFPSVEELVQKIQEVESSI